MATDQELVARVLVALVYVQGLDLSVGDAGAVLVNEGQGGAQVRHAKTRVEGCLNMIWTSGGVLEMEPR